MPGPTATPAAGPTEPLVPPAARLLAGDAATPEIPPVPAPLLLLAADFSEPSSEGLTDPAADAAAEADAAAGAEANAAAGAETGAAADVVSAADCLWASVASELGGGTLMAREPMPLGALPTAKWAAREMAAWEAA